jgi:hypothetical protein
MIRPLIAALALSACAAPDVSTRAHTVRNDNGGEIAAYIARADRLRGQAVVITGECHSACAVLASLPTACLARGARVGLHRPYFVAGGGHSTDNHSGNRRAIWPAGLLRGMTMTNNEAPKGPAAPERIWIQSDHIPDAVALDKWDQKPDPDENQLFTEYTRADLLTAAQARAEQAEAEVRRLRDALVKQIGSVLYPEDRTGYETAQDREARYAQERVNAIATYVGAKDDDEAVAMAYSNVMSTLRAAKSRLAEREAIARAALTEGGKANG